MTATMVSPAPTLLRTLTAGGLREQGVVPGHAHRALRPQRDQNLLASHPN